MSATTANRSAQQLTQTLEHVRRKKRLAFDMHLAFEKEDRELCWRLARQVTPTLHRLKGSARPLPVRRRRGRAAGGPADFVVRLQNTLKRHQVTASLYGHAGTVNCMFGRFWTLPTRPMCKSWKAWLRTFMPRHLAVGGTISGEHGDGLSRTPFVRQQYADLYDVFRDLKRIFDPAAILNPGKIVSDETTLDYAKPAAVHGGGRPAASRSKRPNRRPLERPKPIEVAIELDHGADDREARSATAAACAVAARRRADVSDFSRRTRRGGVAAGQGQPDARQSPRVSSIAICWRRIRSKQSPTCA